MHALEGLTAMRKLLQHLKTHSGEKLNSHATVPSKAPDPTQSSSMLNQVLLQSSAPPRPAKQGVCQGIVMLNGFLGSVHITINDDTTGGPAIMKLTYCGSVSHQVLVVFFAMQCRFRYWAIC